MLIRVQAFPDAKKEAVIEAAPGKLRIFVREPAQNNLANRRIIQLVAAYAGAPVRCVALVTGHRSPNKTLEVRETPDV
jgi:uncharacterized protein YggU (UPF0235/DUF167 family)